MKMLNLLGKALLLLPLALPAFGESSVWKVSKGGNHIFIGGTIHILKQTDYPLPEEFDAAYQASEHLVFEVDAGDAQSIAMKPEILQKMMYTDGRTLKTVLSPETYTLLDNFAKANQIPLQMMNTMKPGLVATQLTVMELMKMGMSPTAGVDMYYNAKAQADGKSKSYLETIDKQLDMLATMGDGFEDEFIEYTIRDLNKVEDMMGAMVSAWRSGDSEGLNKLMVESFDDEFPEIYEQILVSRNKDWIPKIEQLFKDNKIEYVLVGAAHLVGEDSVLKMLEDRGYRVEQL